MDWFKGFQPKPREAEVKEDIKEVSDGTPKLKHSKSSENGKHHRHRTKAQHHSHPVYRVDSGFLKKGSVKIENLTEKEISGQLRCFGIIDKARIGAGRAAVLNCNPVLHKVEIFDRKSKELVFAQDHVYTNGTPFAVRSNKEGGVEVVNLGQMMEKTYNFMQSFSEYQSMHAYLQDKNIKVMNEKPHPVNWSDDSKFLKILPKTKRVMKEAVHSMVAFDSRLQLESVWKGWHQLVIEHRKFVRFAWLFADEPLEGMKFAVIAKQQYSACIKAWHRLAHASKIDKARKRKSQMFAEAMGTLRQGAQQFPEITLDRCFTFWKSCASKRRPVMLHGMASFVAEMLRTLTKTNEQHLGEASAVTQGCNLILTCQDLKVEQQDNDDSVEFAIGATVGNALPFFIGNVMDAVSTSQELMLMAQGRMAQHDVATHATRTGILTGVGVGIMFCPFLLLACPLIAIGTCYVVEAFMKATPKDQQDQMMAKLRDARALGIDLLGISEGEVKILDGLTNEARTKQRKRLALDLVLTSGFAGEAPALRMEVAQLRCQEREALHRREVAVSKIEECFLCSGSKYEEHNDPELQGIFWAQAYALMLLCLYVEVHLNLY
eukprot:gnl/MRDRNA2_/MRDRNA2_156259_c0_seq1.p1 gnl/MRDRNA2_/MRDRNA2_156259_c0~~gnl/MRDRNA2_/MRDRNA2_156259_c0_seq1.p1  ORF type:complete len:604 (+),score=101.68 gnl/MRDRNA2_/MRDRNA2_156259_c0_seq1:102-1913(+)